MREFVERGKKKKGVTMFRTAKDVLRKSKENQGFTLIELLVVVLILGILSAIVVVAVSNARQNAVVSACNADAIQVAKAAQQYYVNEGKWPTSIDDLALDAKYLTKKPDSKEYTIAWNATTKEATVSAGSASGSVPTGCVSAKAG
jgi:type IV pilus assembly protein PilA